METNTFYRIISQILPVFFVVNLGLILQAQGYHSGAPASVCSDMVPHHGVEPQPTTPPYVIGLSSTTYSPKQQISVTIEGKSGEVFKGFMLAARRKGGSDNFGRFIPVPGSHGLNCSNKQDSAITHSDNSMRQRLEFTWESPASNVGDLQIIGTIVESAPIFWVNVTSMVMKPSFPNELSTLPDTLAQSTTTQTPTAANEIRCKSSRNCLIQWRMDKDAGVTHFNLSLESPNARMYIALGLSDDAKMGGDSVMECLRYPNDSILAQLSYNKGYVNTIVASDSVTLTSALFENGWMRCSFTRRNTVDNSQIFNLDGNEWYLLVAIGDVNMNNPNKKNRHSIRFASESKIDLSKNAGVLGVESSNSGILIRVHGSLMIFAWVFFASVGMFAARYSKTINHQIKGVALWFQLHRISMTSTLLFTVVGFIVIFAAAEGKYSRSVGLPYDAHPVLGIIVTILTLSNPIMAQFRPGKDSSNRFLFNWAHRSVGVIAFILADAAIFIGIVWFPHTNQSGSVAVMAIFLVYKVIAVVTMEILECWKQRSVEPIEMKAPGDKTTEDNKAEEYFGFVKTILLICHITITFVLSVLLVIFVNIRKEQEPS